MLDYKDELNKLAYKLYKKDAKNKKWKIIYIEEFFPHILVSAKYRDRSNIIIRYEKLKKIMNKIKMCNR